jgi:hypothetical protein
VRHCFWTGGVLLQAIDSFIPRAIGPHAAVRASRSAASVVAPEATAELRWPWNSTTTLHSTRWDERVL